MSNCNTYEDCGLPKAPHNHYPATYYRVRAFWLDLLTTHTGWVTAAGFECSCGATRPSQMAHYFEVIADLCDELGIELPA